MFNLLAPKEGMYVCKYVCIYTRPQVYVCTVMYVYIVTYIHTYIHTSIPYRTSTYSSIHTSIQSLLQYVCRCVVCMYICMTYNFYIFVSNDSSNLTCKGGVCGAAVLSGRRVHPRPRREAAQSFKAVSLRDYICMYCMCMCMYVCIF